MENKFWISDKNCCDGNLRDEIVEQNLVINVSKVPKNENLPIEFLHPLYDLTYCEETWYALILLTQIRCLRYHWLRFPLKPKANNSFDKAKMLSAKSKIQQQLVFVWTWTTFERRRLGRVFRLKIIWLEKTVLKHHSKWNRIQCTKQSCKETVQYNSILVPCGSVLGGN